MLRTASETELLGGLRSVLESETDDQRAQIFCEAMFNTVVAVGRHFTHTTTTRTDVLSQQFAQLLQFIYGLFDNCGISRRSTIFDAAQSTCRQFRKPIDDLMDLVVYSNPLIAVYWYQLEGRLSISLRITRDEGLFISILCRLYSTPEQHSISILSLLRGLLLLVCTRCTSPFLLCCRHCLYS